MSEGPARPAPPEALSWLLLVAAFSPVLIDLAEHLRDRPWAAYCLVFVPLFFAELRRAPRGRRRPHLGWLCLAIALAGELLLVAGGFTRAARPLLPLAALGLGGLVGRPGPRAAALLLAFVPAPHLLVSWASTALEATWARLAAQGVRLLGLPALVEAGRYQATLHVGAHTVALSDADGGIPVALMLLGIGWYRGLRDGRAIGASVLRAGALALLAAPLQVAAIFAAALGLRAGWLDAPRPFLDLAPWVAVALCVLLEALHRARSREPLSSAAP
jgi:hypothetical protein